jgi:hypothetical protein
MDDETKFNCIDQLTLQAKEDHSDMVQRLERRGFKNEDLVQEVALIVEEYRRTGVIDWSQIFVISLLGEELNVVD